MLASALVLVAAVASLFGPVAVQELVASVWFLVGTGITTLASLLAAAVAARRRSLTGVLQHLGLVVAVAGILVNQTTSRSGYLFLEQGAGASNFFLSRDLRHVDELPLALGLDSVTAVSAKAFRPAPVAWISSNGRSQPVTYNRPLWIAGRQALISQVVAPGFLTEYEVAVDGVEFLLLHNQRAEPLYDLGIGSFAYDSEADRVGLDIGGEQRWLSTGESTFVRGRSVRLLSATFARNVGAVLIVNDIRRRLTVFLGLGLMLFGLLPALFRRDTS